MQETNIDHLKLDLTDARMDHQTLERRIAEFKADPERMNSANQFVNDLLEKAQTEALAKGDNKQVCFLLLHFI